MGGKGRKQNKMFITAKEWSSEWGGAKPAQMENTLFTRLRFDNCSLSFQPMTDPVATSDGTCFERSNILEYIDEHGTHPRTGEPLKLSDLFSLKFHRNANGDYHCPITFKVFNEHSHLVAIKPTGNVFSFDAVNEMNVKFKNWRDLLDDTPFTKQDIVVIQDPHNIHKQNYSEFYHVKNDIKFSSGANEEPDDSIESKINTSSNLSTKRILDELKAKEDAVKAKSKQKLKLEEEKNEQKVAALFAAYKDEENNDEEANEGSPKTAKQQEASSSSTSKPTQPKVKPAAAAAPPVVERKVLYSTHPEGQRYAAASITSTSMAPMRKDRKIELTEEMLRQKAYDKLRLLRKKAYVRLYTSLGELNLELATGSAPMTCHNFLTHCANGYYDGTIFHRSIKYFMIQGGDPTGTGTGGESIFGAPFADEFFDKQLNHQGQGIVSMANSGPNTNKSQFFITYKSAKHLDGKHTIFGKVVGGLETLAKMQRVPTDANDRPKEKIVFLRAEVFVNPIPEVMQEIMDEATKVAPTPEELEAKRKADEEKDKKAEWFSNPAAAFTRPTALSSGIGKYLDRSILSGLQSASTPEVAASPSNEPAVEGGEEADLLESVAKRQKIEEVTSAAPPPKIAPKQQWDFSGW